jgi:hypothetical protein
VSLHKGISDPGLGFTGGREIDPFFLARGISAIRKAGTIMAETLNGGGFDYVGYDNSPMWSASTATVSQREFVYLHGPADKEFVVVLDRFNATNPSADEKIWKIWVPTQPTFVTGSVSTPRPGKWTSSGADTIEVTNKFDRLQGEDFLSAPTHGRFFMKVLWPRQPVINFLGGPGMESQSGDDDGTTPWGTPPMTQAEREYIGWGRVEVRPSIRQNYDLFLNVIQFGDATTLRTIAPISRVDSIEGTLTGTHIGEDANQWVVMLARAASDQFQIRAATYGFRAVVSRSQHLLVNMARSTTFYVSVSSTGPDTTVEVRTQPVGGSTPVASNDHGVLSFEVNGARVIGRRFAGLAGPQMARPATPTGLAVIR